MSRSRRAATTAARNASGAVPGGGGGATYSLTAVASWAVLRRPHPDGGLGALRVEVRGRRGTSRDERVLGVVDRPAVAAGAVVALAARWAAGRRMLRPGAAGLAALVEPIPFLAALAERGVRAAAFEGDAASRVSAASST